MNVGFTAQSFMVRGLLGYLLSVIADEFIPHIGFSANPPMIPMTYQLAIGPCPQNLLKPMHFVEMLNIRWSFEQKYDLHAQRFGGCPKKL